MKTQKAFLISIVPNTFRAGQPAEIIGAAIITPDGLDSRLCYHVRFYDGCTDYVAVSHETSFEIFSEDAILDKVVTLSKKYKEQLAADEQGARLTYAEIKKLAPPEVLVELHESTRIY